jgi:hypothetical protein
MNKITLKNYGHNTKSKNPNTNMVTVGDVQLYFSYETVIAFRYAGKLYVSENIWSRTTGKHLSYIDSDKSRRIKHDQFLRLLNNAMGLDNNTAYGA